MRNNAKPKFLPSMWLVILLTGAGIFGTSRLYNAVSGTGTWAEGLIGLAAMLLCVLILGTPLAMAMVVKKRYKKMQTHA